MVHFSAGGRWFLDESRRSRRHYTTYRDGSITFPMSKSCQLKQKVPIFGASGIGRLRDFELLRTEGAWFPRLTSVGAIFSGDIGAFLSLGVGGDATATKDADQMGILGDQLRLLVAIVLGSEVVRSLFLIRLTFCCPGLMASATLNTTPCDS